MADTRYALIKNSVVTNLVAADAEFINAQREAGAIDEGVDLAAFPGVMVEVGYSYSGGVFSQVLATAKAAKTAQLLSDVRAYRDVYFDSDTVKNFEALWRAAIRKNYSNRLAYIDPLIDWSEALVRYSVGVAAQIKAAASQHALDAIGWDIPTNIGAPPAVTLYGAAQLTS